MGLFTKTSGKGWFLDKKSGTLTISGDVYVSDFFKIRSKVRSIVAEKGVCLKHCGCLFEEMENLEKVDLSGVDISECENLAMMFFGCTNLRSLKLAGWNTSHVTNMRSLFKGCQKLETLDLTGWHVSKNTKTSDMFKNIPQTADVIANDESVVQLLKESREQKESGSSDKAHSKGNRNDSPDAEMQAALDYLEQVELKGKKVAVQVAAVLGDRTPVSEPAGTLQAETKPVSELKPAAETKPIPAPKSTPEPKAESQPEPKAKPEAESAPDSVLCETATDLAYDNYIYTGEVKGGIPNGKGKCVFEDGSTYEGMFADGKQSGKGFRRFTNGNTYEGEYKDGERNGKGVFRWASGDIYEGDFIDNWRTGKGKYTWPGGTVYEGDFVENKMTGKGIKRFAGGDVLEGDFVDGKCTGKGKYTWKDGAVYEGDFVDGNFSGKGIKRWPDGTVYEGDFVDDKMTGKGKKRLPNGDVYEGDFEDGKYIEKNIPRQSYKNQKTIKYSIGTYTGEVKNGVPNGVGKLVLKDGVTIEGTFVNGKPNGKGILRWADGDTYEGEFIDGKRTGKGRFRWASGAVYEGDFIDGKQTGKGFYTFVDGGMYDGDFIDGKFMGKGIIRLSDGTTYEGDFKDGKIVGKGKIELPDGDTYEGDFVDGSRSGKGTYTWDDGTAYEGDFIDNKITGKGRVYFKWWDGSVLVEEYINGDPVKRNDSAKIVALVCGKETIGAGFDSMLLSKMREAAANKGLNWKIVTFDADIIASDKTFYNNNDDIKHIVPQADVLLFTPSARDAIGKTFLSARKLFIPMQMYKMQNVQEIIKLPDRPQDGNRYNYITVSKGVTVRIENKHSNEAAMAFVREVERFRSKVWVRSGYKVVPGNSLNGLANACFRYKYEIDIMCDGPDEEEALAHLVEFVENNFGIKSDDMERQDNAKGATENPITCVIYDPFGFHMRPVSLLVKEASRLLSEGTIITITKDGKSGKAAHMVAVMSLGIKYGDTITVRAEGGDEAAAIETMKKLFIDIFDATIL